MPETRAATCPALHWHSEADVQAFAQRLAATPEVGSLFIELRGDLGAGKTTFVRHLLRALGAAGRIKSPTYAVVEPYTLACGAVWHFDFYRFSDPREWLDAGFRDIFASPGLKLVEWPEKAGDLLPTADWVLHIDTVSETERAVRIDAPTPLGQSALQQVL
jgi:tRNA threonylcarbamoyladenosine biosynthesis protein TsaE